MKAVSRLGVVTAITALLAAGCADRGDEPISQPSGAELDSAQQSTTTTVERITPTTTVSAAELEQLEGTIAAAGRDGIVLLAPTGDIRSSLVSDVSGATQPTYSRDGERLVATVFDQQAEAFTVAATVGGELVRREPARRPYFFYSWSSTGNFIAALGPGPAGTSLDILGPDGVPIHGQSIDAGSFYLAWAPDRDELLVHLDETLWLVRDVTALDELEALGEPGQRFLAPAWIPGTRSALIVDAESASPRLTAVDVDTAELTDFGAADAFTGVQVSPDGSRALLAHNRSAGGSADLTVAFSADDASSREITAATEMVDLDTGQRWPIGDELTLWAEWSPDGSTVARLEAPDDGGLVRWVAWSDGFERSYPSFSPSIEFFRSYLPFSWQFTETPRIWSPDSEAFVYTAVDDGQPHVFVQRLTEDGPADLGVSPVAFWSPS